GGEHRRRSRRLRAGGDDPARARRAGDRRGTRRGGGHGDSALILELQGFEVFGRHGVLEEEKLEGQVFLYDVALEVEEPAADRVEAAVDYRLVAACVQEVSDSGSFELIETLAAAVADALVARPGVSGV